MLGQHHSLTTLKSRKRALLEEAEAQREELRCDMEIVRSGLRGMRTQAKSIGSITSAVALATAGFSAFRAARGLVGMAGSRSFREYCSAPGSLPRSGSRCPVAATEMSDTNEQVEILRLTMNPKHGVCDSIR
jgi:hypothetical protein